MINSEKTADIFINAGSSSYTDAQIQAAVDNYLKPKLLTNNITANVDLKFNYAQLPLKLTQFLLHFDIFQGVAMNENGDLYKWGLNNNFTLSANINATFIESGVKAFGLGISDGSNGKYYKLKTNGNLYRMPPYDGTVSDAVYFSSGTLIATNIATLDGIGRFNGLYNYYSNRWWNYIISR